MTRCAATALLLLLGACQSARDPVRPLLASGALRVEEAPTPGRGYDYAVTLRDEPGLGYDPANRAEREALAGRAAGRTCAAPLVVREDRVVAARAYVLRVRCRPA
jgi:hypothetical protein